jgi:hypothetical protein
MLVRSLSTIALLGTFLFSANEPNDKHGAEQEIRNLEMQRLRFPNQTSNWSANVAAGALFLQGNGTIVKREEFLTGTDEKVYNDSLEMADTQFSQMGDVAVFSYIFTRTRHDDATAIRHQHLRRTVVYQHTANGWQMITSAAAVVPYADLESKPVDPAILDSYVGIWPDTPAPTTVTLTRDGTKLMAQGSNEKQKTELLALSDDTFVVRGEPALITFQRRRDGAATKVFWRDIGGSVQINERPDPGKSLH